MRRKRGPQEGQGWTRVRERGGWGEGGVKVEGGSRRERGGTWWSTRVPLTRRWDLKRLLVPKHPQGSPGRAGGASGPRGPHLRALPLRGGSLWTTPCCPPCPPTPPSRPGPAPSSRSSLRPTPTDSQVSPPFLSLKSTLYSTRLYSTVLYSTVLYSTVLYSTVRRYFSAKMVYSMHSTAR